MKTMYCELSGDTLVQTMHHSSVRVASLDIFDTDASKLKPGVSFKIKRDLLSATNLPIEISGWSFLGNKPAYEVITEKGLKITCGERQQFLVTNNKTGESCAKSLLDIISHFNAYDIQDLLVLNVLPSMFNFDEDIVYKRLISTEHIVDVVKNRRMDHSTDLRRINGTASDSTNPTPKELLDYQWFFDDHGRQFCLNKYKQTLLPLLDRTASYQYWSSETYANGLFYKAEMFQALRRICHNDTLILEYLLREGSVEDRIIAYSIVRDVPMYSLSIKLDLNTLPVFKANGITVYGHCFT